MSTPAGTEGQAPQGQQGTGQGQAPDGQGQGKAPDQQGQQTDQQNAGDAGIDLSTIQDPAVRAILERQQAELTRARQEAARYRTERNQFEGQVTEFQRAQETEAQRIQREQQEREERLQALERENRDLKVNSRVEAAATAARAHNPATVVRMLAGQVELDDKGEPKNLQDLLTSLKETDPYLFKRQRVDAGDGGDGEGNEGAATDMNSLIRGQVAARRGR